MRFLFDLLRQCAIILACLGLAEWVVYLTDARFPPALLGMLLLALALKTGLVKLDWVKGLADFLHAYFGLFFVPPGVALMLHFDLIGAEWLPITVATLLSTLAVFAVTGWTHQLLRRRR